MDAEMLTGNIVVLLCNLFCSITFVAISIWARKRTSPMHFYSGTSIDPRTVSDIPAYNKANAKMWMIFSIPFMLSLVLNLLAFFIPMLFVVSVILVALDCTAGIAWLMIEYNRIAKEFIIR